MEMVSRVCPICGSNDRRRVFAEECFDATQWSHFAFASRKLPEYMHYRMIVCPNCDLLYADPVPPLDVLVGEYQLAGYDSAVEAEYAARTYGRLLRGVLGRLPDRIGALDIGAGDGAFLKQLIANGFTGVVGVEPSEAPIAAAEETVRPLIRRGVFRAEDFARESFRLITCFQTIEHLYDPLRVCRDACSLLKEDGALLLVFHNRRAISATILGLRSPIFDIEHLQLFSRRSARVLLQASGCQDVQISTVYNCYPLSYWIKLFPLPRIAKNVATAASERIGIGRVAVACPAGNLAAVAFKRRCS
jgi:SAM-dependent methyltransferase